MTTILRNLTADDSAAVEHVRQFFRNYAAWLGVDLSFQGFEEEMASLPGAYAAPSGRLFYAERDGQPAGCVGIRPLSAGLCEMKRLYVEPGSAVVASVSSWRWRRSRRPRISVTSGCCSTPCRRCASPSACIVNWVFTKRPRTTRRRSRGPCFSPLDLQNWTEEEVANENLFHLFDFNRAWSNRMQESDAEYFMRLSRLQTPEYLLDRLFRFAGAGERDRRPAAGRDSSCIATSPTSSCIPISTACR